MSEQSDTDTGDTTPEDNDSVPRSPKPSVPSKEIGGRRDGLDPVRYGDWEKNGRCIDF